MLLSGKYYLIEQDPRFSLTITGQWQPLSGKALETPTGTYIYSISGNNNLYIGSSKTAGRPYRHKNDLLNCKHHSQYLQRAVNLHSLNAFYFQPIVRIPDDVLLYRDEIENAYIKLFDTYKNGYNMCEFADTPLLFAKRSQETKDKISNGRKGIKFSDEHLKKLSLSHKGKRLSEESISKYAKTYRFLNPEGELVTIHNLNKFCRENDLNNAHMVQVHKGKVPSHKGWKKVNE